MEEEDASMVAWTLSMQECGLSTTLQRLKMKVVKLLKTRPTFFKNGVLGNF